MKRLRAPILLTLAVFVLAWAVSAGFTLYKIRSDRNWRETMTSCADCVTYQRRAREILAPPPDEPQERFAPYQWLQAAYLAAHYKLLGVNADIGPTVVAVNNLLNAAAAALIFLALWQVMPGSWWLAMIGLMIFNKDLLIWQSMVMTEALFNFTGALFFLFAILAWRQPRKAWVLAALAVAALLTMTARINGVLYLGAAALLSLFFLLGRWLPSASARLLILGGSLGAAGVILLILNPTYVFRLLMFAMPDLYFQMADGLLPPLTLPVTFDGSFFHFQGNDYRQGLWELATSHTGDYLKLLGLRGMSFLGFPLPYRAMAIRVYLLVSLVIILLYLWRMPKPINGLADKAFLLAVGFIASTALFNVLVTMEYDFRYRSVAEPFQVFAVAVACRQMAASLLGRFRTGPRTPR